MPRKPAKRPPGRPPRTDQPERVTVLLPAVLRRRLKIQAFEEGRDMGDVVADALGDYLKRQRGKGR